MEDLDVPDHLTGRHEAVAARVDAPAMPAVTPGTLWRGSPYLIARAGQRYTLGWQDAKQDGPCFVVTRTTVMDSVKVLDRFPLTEDGWARAWATLVKLDAGAAQAVAKAIQQRLTARATQAAEKQRSAQIYETFVSARPATTYRTLGVQVLAGVGRVYTIGSHDAVMKANTSRLLGPLAGAQATVTDGSQAWSPGRAMFLPIGLAGLATKTKADAAVVFPDGTVHTAGLDGNNAVREAQKQVVQFNALAGASTPTAAESGSDPAVKLRKLQELRDAGLLSQEEYATKRAEVVKTI
jgi:hypothetical protein